MNFKIPKTMFSCISHKRKFSVPELYAILVLAPRAVAILKRNESKKVLDEKFLERIMLAVTEVNGCVACSWAHTQIALEKGVSSEEISSLLGGKDEYIRPEEAKALLFAQHYADKKGRPLKKMYEAIVEEYGSEKAKIILSAAQVMMVGNVFGLSFSVLLAKKQGISEPGSSVVREVLFLVVGIILIPFAFLHAGLRKLVCLPNINYAKQ